MGHILPRLMPKMLNYNKQFKDRVVDSFIFSRMYKVADLTLIPVHRYYTRRLH